MKKGVIVTNAYYTSSSPTHQAERLLTEFKLLKTDVYIYKNNAYDAYIDENGKLRCSFDGLDFAVFLDKDKYLSRIIEGCGVKMFNTTRAVELCDDKMLTHLALSEGGVQMPSTMPAPLCYSSAAEIDEEEADKVISVLGLPLVVKCSFGSLGKEVFLVQTRFELINAMNALKGKPHFFQQYISSSFGRDVRIIVIGGKALCAMMRKSKDDFRSNIDLGGEGFAYLPDKSFIDSAEKAAKILNLDYCGVDLLFGSQGEPVLCEVNSNAFFREMERVTGINVANAYARYVLDNL